MTNTKMLEPELQALAQFFAAATQHASIAMCQWTRGHMTLSVDEICVAPVENLAKCMNLDTELMTPVAMVVVDVQGHCGGQLILAFDETHGRRLAASLLGRELNGDPQWSDLEKSAVMETGNILSSAYLNEMTRLTDRPLQPSAPYFCQDFGGSVLQQAVAAQAMLSDRILVCRTQFQFDQEQVNWNVFFVPQETLLRAMQESVCSAN